MTLRTAQQERRKGIVWVVGSLVMLLAMMGMWWLVEETNEEGTHEEGTHDAELLPFFALIPLVIGAYHLVRARIRHL